MIRFASFFTLACLTLAAMALLSTSRSLAQEQPQEDNGNAKASNRLADLTAERVVSFHARFSLN